MKRLLLSMAMAWGMWVMATMPAWAQAPDATAPAASEHTTAHVEYYMTYADMVSDHRVDAGTVTVVTASRNKQMWWGGKDFKFKSDNKEVQKVLKKGAFALLYNDTLLLNTRPYNDRGAKFGAGYARAYELTDGKLLMTYFNVANMQSKAMMGAMFGLVGALAVSGSGSKVVNQDVCYIVTPDVAKAQFVNEKVMEVLLKDHADLWSRYSAMDKKERERAEVVMPLLREIGLLK